MEANATERFGFGSVLSSKTIAQMNVLDKHGLRRTTAEAHNGDRTTEILNLIPVLNG